MTTVSLSAFIDDDRKLVIDLPDEIPAGEVEIEVHSKPEPKEEKIPDARGSSPFTG